MNNTGILTSILQFVLYVLLQVVLVRNTHIAGWAFCFPYVGFLMMLPFDIGRVTLMVIGFLLGISVDIFYDSLGMHAGTMVLVAYFRGNIINVNTPVGGYDSGMIPTIKSMGFRWYSVYAMLILLLHHLTLFLIEASNLSLFFYSLGKAGASIFFTFFVLVVLQYLFYYPNNRR